MEAIHILTVVFWSGLPLCLRAECPELMTLMEQTQTCYTVLEDHKADALTGALNVGNKRKACQHYDEGNRCVDELISSCQGYRDEHSRFTAIQFKNDEKAGFGQLCDNATYFAEYMSFAPCFEKVQDRTEVCLRNFIEGTADENGMCSAITTLRHCVNNAVTPSCGPEANEFYFELCKHQVPSAALTHCYSTLAIETTTPIISLANMSGSPSYHLLWLLELIRICLNGIQ